MFDEHIYVNNNERSLNATMENSVNKKMKKLIEFHLKLEILSVSFVMSALIKIIIE